MQLPLLISATFFIVFAIPTMTLFFLGLFHKLFGVRDKYKELLLFIFEKGRQRIEKSQRPLDPELNDEKPKEQKLHPDPPEENQCQESDDEIPIAYNEREGPSPDFDMSEAFDLITAGIQAIVQDQVTHRFEAEELQSWNLLTRTNHGYEFISYKLTAIWVLGFYIRYLILLPLRVIILLLGTVTMTFLTGLVGPIPNTWRVKRLLNDMACRISFKMLSRAFSAIITYHDEQYKPAGNGICVANHTSPIDVVILSCNSSFSLIGQSHGGFLGILQRALARASSHIWFDRSEMKDRAAVSRRLKKHAQDPTKPPILIFPEGTCINNSAVMQFKKGSFEVDSVIYPVAIKYDPRFGDAFWNSSKHGMLHYVYRMMTSWAIVCDVWYLPAMYRKDNETAVDFANRVKAEIAHKGGLVDLDWDGGLKRSPAKKEWKEKQQLEISKKLILNNNSLSRKSSSCAINSGSEYSEDEFHFGPTSSNCSSPVAQFADDDKGLILEASEEEVIYPKSNGNANVNIVINAPTPLEIKKEE